MVQLITSLLLVSHMSFGDGFFESVKDDITSPLQKDTRGYLHLGLATSAFMYIFFKDDVILGLQQESIEHKPLGDYALYGDYGGQLIPNAIYAGGMYTSYLLSDNEDHKRFASQMFRATLYSGVLTNLIKFSVNETRPDGSSRDSFPSGHTTTAFAFASVVAMNHDWYWAVPAYTFAAFVGYSRINDNKHYLHDVTVGATIGAVYGMGIYYLDQKNEQHAESGKRSPTYTIAPMIVPQGGGLQFISTF